ncbi:MAG: hypothetical protein J5841_06330 [Clostridia bacterium]|nr:hypothetical protein [Clostridia bacterium]
MLKKIILCVLCLLTIFSACAAEELPSRVYECKIHMYPDLPENTMKALLSEYMVPGCEVTYEENMAWCGSLTISGYGWYRSAEAVTEDSERIRKCREIAEKVLHTAYPESEPELITAMPYQDYEVKCTERSECFDLKDGRWYYMGRPLTQELEGALTAARLNGARERERIEQIDPDWTVLQYHPGPVCGLPVGLWLEQEYTDFCLTSFIFDAENHIVSVNLGGSFTAEPVRETAVKFPAEEAIRLAAEKNDGTEIYDWRTRGWEGNAYDVLLKELGCASIRIRMVSDEAARLVIAVNKKGRLQPAWECSEHYELLMDDEVIQEYHQGPWYFYISAEDGSLLNP